MSNIAFVLRSLHRYDRKILPYSAAVALLGVAVPFVGILLPKLVIDLLVSNVAPVQILVRIGGYTLMMTAVYFMHDFCTRNRGWRNEHIADGSVSDLYRKNLTCEYSYLENPEKQSLFARLKQNIVPAGNAPGENCFDKSISALTGVVTGILGFALYSFILSELNVLIVLLLTLTVAANYFALRRANRYEHNNKDKWTPLESKIAYILRVSGDYEYGKDIRMYHMKPRLAAMAKDLFAKRKMWNNRVQNKHFAAKAANALTILLRDGAAYALLIYAVTQGEVSIADFMLFFGAISGFSVFVTSVIENIGKLGSALPYVADLREYMKGGNVKEPDSPVCVPDTKLPPTIEFRGVSFSYVSGEKTLDNLSFTVNAGEKLAIVGLNGAGKTTIVKLLCGFYTPDEGEILIDGEDIRRFRRQDLYNLFSAVFQEEFIMPLTLAENITPNSDDEAGIQRALEKAGLSEYTDTPPDGLQPQSVLRTLMTKAVREDGIILSGGQKQKLYLARALYKDAPVLILDEPTAALDPIAESEIYEKYCDLTSGKTAIFISHRLASTRFCDRLILIENGTVAESGSHDELMAQGGQYANLFEIQSQYYKEDV